MYDMQTVDVPSSGEDPTFVAFGLKWALYDYVRVPGARAGEAQWQLTPDNLARIEKRSLKLYRDDRYEWGFTLNVDAVRFLSYDASKHGLGMPWNVPGMNPLEAAMSFGVHGEVSQADTAQGVKFLLSEDDIMPMHPWEIA